MLQDLSKCKVIYTMYSYGRYVVSVAGGCVVEFRSSSSIQMVLEILKISSSNKIIKNKIKLVYVKEDRRLIVYT